MKKIKIIMLYILKYTGLFHLMRRFNRRKLCILGYHGISQRDENHFQPSLFMSEVFFRARMILLLRLNYPVISLDEAVKGLRGGSLPDNAVVITFDDGWEGIFSKAVPILQDYNYPAMIYMVSYYTENGIPVLDVCLRYILWKSKAISLDLGQLGEDGLSGVVPLKSSGDKQKQYKKLLFYVMQKSSAVARYDFLERICRKLNVDWDQIQSDRMFRLATAEMIREYSKIAGIDIGLHTHHHIFPDDCYESCREEILENQQKLSDWTGKKSRHFCYPSGDYSVKQIDWLKRMAILSATTVEPKLNGYDVSLWELGRFLDGQNVSDIEFEAELCGMSNLLRRLMSG